MIELNEHAKTALLIAKQRDRIGQASSRTDSVLKHCAGEVCEAMEAYTAYKLDDTNKSKQLFAGELADIITCVLILSAAHEIDIENALALCQQKNEARINGASL